MNNVDQRLFISPSLADCGTKKNIIKLVNWEPLTIAYWLRLSLRIYSGLKIVQLNNGQNALIKFLRTFTEFKFILNYFKPLFYKLKKYSLYIKMFFIFFPWYKNIDRSSSSWIGVKTINYNTHSTLFYTLFQRVRLVELRPAWFLEKVY